MNKLSYPNIKLDGSAKQDQLESQFLSTVSHELRTPLNGILGMAQILDGTDLDEQQSEYLNMLRQSSEYLLSIINDILDYAQIGSNKFQLRNEPLNLPNILKDILRSVEVAVNRKNLKIYLDIDDDFPEMLMGDEKRIKQIMINIINNAIKFTDRGSINISLCAKKNSDGKSFEIIFSVKDTGIGIPSSDLKDIFERFFRTKNIHSNRHRGTGLGLAITNQLIQMMQGRITVESRLRMGSTFSCYFNLNQRSFSIKQPDKINSMNNRNKNTKSFLNTTVLVVEDEPINQKVIEIMLMKYLTFRTPNVKN